MQRTSNLVSIVGRRDIWIINAAVHADIRLEVVDLVKTQLAVQVEEYYAFLYRQIRVCLQIPNIKQVFIVQQEQCISNTDHIAKQEFCTDTLTWCSLYACFAAMPQNGQVAYWWSGCLPVYRTAIPYNFFWNFVPFKFVFNITFHS